MLISAKQHEANRQNAQHSTGPKTPEGKEAVRDNALTYGLRTRHMILPNENLHHYLALFDAFEAEYRPCTRTEWCYLETIITSQWLLVRLAASERQICEETGLLGKQQYRLLDSVYKRRAQLERAFRNAVADLKQTQKERRAQPGPAAEPVPLSTPGPPNSPRPGKTHRNPSTASPPEPTPVSCLPPWSLTISCTIPTDNATTVPQPPAPSP